MKPYSFEAVYPVAEVIDIGRRAANGEVDFALGEDVAGCTGCVLKKLGGGDVVPGPFGSEAAIAGIDLENASVEELGETLKTSTQVFGATEDGQDAEAIPPFVVPILLALGRRIAERLLERWINR